MAENPTPDPTPTETSTPESPAPTVETPSEGPSTEGAEEGSGTDEAETQTEAEAEASSTPRVFAFMCPNGQAATFVGEGGHSDQHGGHPVIPRDVRCPVCGHNMVLREPFDLATAEQVAREVENPEAAAEPALQEVAATA